MMRFVSPFVHGVLDYTLAALFLVLPLWLIAMSPAAQLASFAFGSVLLLMSLLTRYPLGVLRVIPFTVHGKLEFVGALVLIALPWLAGFTAVAPARNFFLATGVLVLALWATTDYRAAAPGKPGVVGPQHPHRA